jgi:hypothetical protein
MAFRAGLQTVVNRSFLSLPAIKLSRPPRSLMTTLTKYLGRMETTYSVTCILGMYVMSFYHNSLWQWRTQEFCSRGGGGWGSTNSVENRGQRDRGSGGGSPLVRGSAQFAIRFDFVILSGCRRLLRMYFPRNWEFGSALSKLRNFRV